MRRAGVDTHTIMMIDGWKTASMSKRYDIVDEQGLREAAPALDRRREQSQLSHNQPSETPQTEPQTTVVQ
jgi:hypothetical protein